jgi:flagellar hook-associated protein 2
MSTAPSVLNAALSALGSSNSGFDVTSTVNAILTADRIPEVTWQAQQATLAKQTAAINQIQSEASSLSDQLNALQDPLGALTYVSASTSDSNVLTASAVPGTATGNHTVVVKSLAVTGSSYSNTVASSSAQLGPGGFTLTANGVSKTITTGSGINTLDQLASSINSQNLGVNASVITDTTGSRLALVAAASGTAADFSISSQTGLSFSHTSGADAALTVDGVPITSASNTVTGAVNGLTLSLSGLSAPNTSVSIGLAPNATFITQAVTSFVTAYNTLFNDLKSQFTFSTATGTSGILSADSTVRSLQEQLLASTNYSSGASVASSLNSLGISTNQDGTLAVNSAALSNSIANNFSEVANFFQGQNTNGFASSLNNTLSTFTDPTQGAFTVDLSSINSENSALTNQTATLERYLATEKTRLTAEYSKADIALQQLPQTIKQIQTLLGYNNATNG